MGCIWCIQSKPLMVTVHMQARGFTPGEKIEVILDVNNQSSQDVAYFSIGLFKVSKLVMWQRKCVYYVFWVIHNAPICEYHEYHSK